MSGGNQPVSGAHARALGNHDGASVDTGAECPPRSAARSASERSAEHFLVTINEDACLPSSEGFAVVEHPCNVPFDRSNDRGKPGPQFLVRGVSMRPVTGRPEAAEQAHIAEGVGALLQLLRGERQMSVRDLEARSGVTRSTISRIERGLRRPRRSTLGWLAWGLDADNVVPITQQLAAAAGDSLIAESRWSERTHARHAADALMRETMPVPLVLLAPYAVAALGSLMPGDVGRLRQVQEHASEMPWPAGLAGSPEALAICDELLRMPRKKLAAVGQAAARVNDFQKLQEQRQRERSRKAVEREEFRRKGRYSAGRRMPARIL